MPNSAVDWASDIALKYNARLILPHVITEDRLATFPKTFALSERDHRQGIGANPAEHLVEAAETRAATLGVKLVETFVLKKTRHKQSLPRQTASRRPHLGRRGLGNLPAFVLGSVSSKVPRLTDCACLTAK